MKLNYHIYVRNTKNKNEVHYKPEELEMNNETLQ